MTSSDAVQPTPSRPWAYARLAVVGLLLAAVIIGAIGHDDRAFGPLGGLAGWTWLEWQLADDGRSAFFNGRGRLLRAAFWVLVVVLAVALVIAAL